MSRLYVVENGGGEPHLVRAHTKASAIKAVAHTKYKAAVASQDQIVELVSKGIKVLEIAE